MSTTASFCRSCGKALTDQEKAVPGTILCAACGPAPPPQAEQPAAGPQTPRPSVSGPASPGVAFLLGLIPGVGAIYNGQYAKGLVHVFVFGVLMTIAESARGGSQPMLVLMTMGWYFYMPFEAYHTAMRRARGEVVDEFSSLVSLKGGSMAGPAVLIILGVVFLLNNLDLLHISQLVRFWPVALIALGVYLLYTRLTGSNPAALAEREVRHE